MDTGTACGRHAPSSRAGLTLVGQGTPMGAFSEDDAYVRLDAGQEVVEGAKTA